MVHQAGIVLALALAASACVASTAVQPWGQCGGQGYTGSTSCTSGWTCTYSNPWYSQCLEGVAAASIPASSSSAAAALPESSSAASSASSAAGWVSSYAPASSSAAPVVAPSSAVAKVASTSSAASIPASSSSAAAALPASSSAASSAAGWVSSYAPASSSAAPIVAPSSAVTKVAGTSSAASVAATGTTYKSSFTHYGAGDSFGSPNCQTNTAACGFFTSPGFSAAVSQNVYGVGPGAGAGPACGTCWKLVGETDSTGAALPNAGTSIIVMVNNLCPASGNPLCSQSGLSGTNQYGANVNFDLCSDSGAESAFFGGDIAAGIGLAIGTAQEVDCAAYSGTIVH